MRVWGQKTNASPTFVALSHPSKVALTKELPTGNSSRLLRNPDTVMESFRSLTRFWLVGGFSCWISLP